MTDEQIIKALEEVSEDNHMSIISQMICGDALDLINRQKAENEKLKDLSDRLGNDIDIKLNYIYDLEEKIETVKSEAIKEFAERLKRYSFVDNLSLNGKETVYVDDIDDLVKEMTEVDKNE